MAYTPAQTAAMNRQGAAYLKSKGKNTKGKSLTPQFDKLKQMSSNLPTNQLIKSMSGQSTPTYNPPSGTASLGNQKAGGGSASNYSTMPDWLNVGSTGMTPQSTVPETERPDWIPTGGNYQGGAVGSTDFYGDQIDTIDDYAERLKSDRLASLRSAYDQNRTDLYAQKPMIQQEASGMRNATDTSYYQSLPELYKAMESGGQRGGENITGMVGLNTVRGQGMNNANLYETNNLRNIENAVTSLGSQQTQAEADVLAGIDADTYSARIQAMRDAVSQSNTQRQQEKSDYMNTIGAYSDDFMQEINNLRSQGVPDSDYRIKALLDARNDKRAGQAASAYEAQQDADANALAWYKAYNSGSNSGGSSLTYEQALALYQAGDRSDAVKRALGIQ
jgi:hypothetical protein